MLIPILPLGVVLRYTYDPLRALSSIQYTNGGGTWHNYYVRCTLSGDKADIMVVFHVSAFILRLYAAGGLSRTL